MKSLLTIKEAAQFLGVSSKTLRRWENAGRIKSLRTKGGHRRFYREDLLKYKRIELLTIGYARINKKQQNKDLQKQVNCLQNYCKNNKLNPKLIQFLDSDIDYKNKQLIQLIQLICNQQVKQLVLTYQEQSLKPVDNLIFSICRLFEVKIILISCSEEGMLEKSLREDWKDLVTPVKYHYNCQNNQTNGQVLDVERK